MEQNFFLLLIIANKTKEAFVKMVSSEEYWEKSLLVDTL